MTNKSKGERATQRPSHQTDLLTRSCNDLVSTRVVSIDILHGENEMSLIFPLLLNFGKTVRKGTFIFLFIACFLTIFSYPQKAEDPILIGTWTKEHEDYEEFIYHRVEKFAFEYLKQNPNAKLVARLCSKEKLAAAFANSHGTAYALPRFTSLFKIPIDKVFFARWSKCADRSDQYWFLPENGEIEFDEMVGADKVEVKRWLSIKFFHPDRQSLENEFAENIEAFIRELNDNPNTEGFIIRNIDMKERNLKKALKQIEDKKLDSGRFKILRKQVYKNDYPEFMTVLIQK